MPSAEYYSIDILYCFVKIFANQIQYLILWFLHWWLQKCSASEKTGNSNSIDQKFTHRTEDQASSDVSSHNKNYLDRSSIIPIEPAKQIGSQLLSANEINVSLLEVKPFEISMKSNKIEFLFYFFISQICSSYNLPPTTYITMKTVLLSGCEQARRQATAPVELKVKNYLTKAGWMKASHWTPHHAKWL